MVKLCLGLKLSIISQVTKQKYGGRLIPGLSGKLSGKREGFASLTKHHFLCKTPAGSTYNIRNQASDLATFRTYLVDLEV
jgi:hypothetical protein